MTSSESTIELSWTYTPTDYFEDPVKEEFDGQSLLLDNGRVTISLASSACPDLDEFRSRKHEEVRLRFYAAQIVNHKPFTLSNPTSSTIHPDGQRDYCVSLDFSFCAVKGPSVDVLTTDGQGKVIRDTRADRIADRAALAALAAECALPDETAAGMLRSYSAAVADPSNELIHLYEILDAAKKRFRGVEKACKALHLSNADWNAFGILANVEPLQQGRHRGQNPGSLRAATDEELSKARNVAGRVIRNYLVYLKKP